MAGVGQSSGGLVFGFAFQGGDGGAHFGAGGAEGVAVFFEGGFVEEGGGGVGEVVGEEGAEGFHQGGGLRGGEWWGVVTGRGVFVGGGGGGWGRGCGEAGDECEGVKVVDVFAGLEVEGFVFGGGSGWVGGIEDFGE